MLDIIGRNHLEFKTVGEIGCGAGIVLNELARHYSQQNVSFAGYDIAPQAIALAKKNCGSDIRLEEADLLAENNTEFFDLLLVADVLEHVPDYLGFVSQCKAKATYKIYHIPLDLSLSSLLRNSFLRMRANAGHLHYFTADSALATLSDTGHEIVDYTYTDFAIAFQKQHPRFGRTAVNMLRRLLSVMSAPLTARLLGGYSLMVLTR